MAILRRPAVRAGRQLNLRRKNTPEPSCREYAAAILLGPFFGLDPWTAKLWPAASGLSTLAPAKIISTVCLLDAE
jgi:hypothetical protein